MTDDTLRDALKTAIGHIEHMSAWIALRNAGYSFEGLGEDMPGIRAALDGAAGAAVSGPDHVLMVTYTNWRGETAVRRIVPKGVRFGSTKWHPEPQWLLLAWDDDKQADREFALKDFGALGATMAATTSFLEGVEFASLIDKLRASEGDSVTILCDNPDFNGQPDRVVVVNGEWTDWQDRRFGGDTLVQALRAGAKARQAAKGEQQ